LQARTASVGHPESVSGYLPTWNLEPGTWNLELVRTPQPESFRYLLILTGPTDPDKQI